VPEAPVIYNERTDLRRFELPNDSPVWDWGGVAWQFESSGGLVIPDDVTLAIPGTGAKNETVLALSHTGDWIEIPSTPVTLAGGKPGRKVDIGDIPTPWILVVAKPTGKPFLKEPPLSSELEQLYWTDREEWKSKTLDALSRIDLLEPEDSIISVQNERTCKDLCKDLDEAYQLLGAARYGGVLDLTGAGTPLPVIGLSPFALYMEGLDKLHAVLKEWNKNKTKWQAQQPNGIYYSDDQTVAEAIESALAFYVPWGIDLTRFLLHTGTIGTFDMRVIGPYGELLYADAPLSNPHENKAIGINVAKLAAKGITANCYMRLYSRRAVQTTWVDYLKDWKLQTVVRWAPAILVTAGIVGGAVTPAVLFAAADQIIDFAQSEYSENNGSTYLHLEAASASTSAGALVLETSADALDVGGVTTSVGGTSLNIIQTLYSVALLYGVSQTDWYMIQEVQPLTAGTRSYCPKGDCTKALLIGDTIPIDGYDQIPPIQVVAVLQDVPPKHPPGGYPAQRTRLQAWTLPFPQYNADLHRLFSNGASCEATSLGISQEVLCPYKGKWSGGIADLPFEKYKKDSWPEVIQLTEPAAQCMRLGIPKTVLNQIASDYGLGASPKPADYGIFIRAAASDGSRAVFVVDNFLDPKPDESKDNVYIQVLIEGKWAGKPADLSGIESEYDGIRSKMSGGTLQARLTVELLAHDDDDPRAVGNVDFTARGIKDIEIYPGLSGQEHLHFAKVSLAVDDGIFGIYDITWWELQSGASDLISLYNEGVFHYSPRCATAGCCYLRVLNFDQGKRSVAEIWACREDGTSYFHRVADSQTYIEAHGSDSQLLAPIEYDNFFSLSGNVLTGSYSWNWYGTPGQPAINGAWHTINATFDKGKVSGRIIQHQRVNQEIQKMQFGFEGQLR
jgi:hypothetical protein